MQGLGLIFFFAFAVIIVMMYIAMRRGWAAPGRIALFGTLGSIITMTLSQLSTGVMPIQGIFFGVLSGAAFAGAALAVAWYFHRSESRPRAMADS